MAVTKFTDSKGIWNQAFLHVDLLMEQVSSLHKGWAKPSVSPVQGCALTSSVGFLSILGFFFWGRDHKRGRERQTEVRTFLLVAVFVPWLATPTSMAALEQSRTLGTTHTSYHCCLLHRPGTDTAHCTAWTTHSNSATFSWPTIETCAWQMDRSPTTSHSTGRLCITPVVFIVVPLLLLLLPPLLSLLFLYSSPLSLRCRVYTVLHVSPFPFGGLCFGWN